MPRPNWTQQKRPAEVNTAMIDCLRGLTDGQPLRERDLYSRLLLAPYPPAGERVVRPAVRGLDGDELLAIGGDEYLCGWCPWD